MWLRLLAVALGLTCIPAASAQAPAPKPLKRVTAADLEGGARRGSAFLRESLLDPGAARPERATPYEP